jgi:branched-chain amino acid transport system ATP-binding protein
MSEILRVRGASKRFGGLQALSDVSLTVQQGQVYGLIGPNGAGKTTLFNVITGFYQPDEGTLEIDGKPYLPRSPHLVAASGIARTFQNIRLFGSMSVLENVLVGMHLRGEVGLAGTLLRTKHHVDQESQLREAGRRMLEFVGLLPLAQRDARTLSYGDQRRLEIARALAVQPKLLALDEPAAGMNPSEKVRLRALLRSIVGRGVSILLIEHDVKLVMGLCDEITVLDYGKVIARGAPEIVRHSPEFIEAYLGHAGHVVQL